MSLKTSYLGFNLPHPFIPGASPLSDDLDSVRKLEDVGAPMIVMSSLFEEQLTRSSVHGRSAPQGKPDQKASEAYLEHMVKLKHGVEIPIIASLNCTSRGNWLSFALQLEQAGVDALELNMYQVPADSMRAGSVIESENLQMVRALKTRVKLPLAVKLSPYYSSLSHFAHGLFEAGADALVLFNRFLQADLDVEKMEMTRFHHLSTSGDVLLRLHWITILRRSMGSVQLAGNGGVHTAQDAVKLLVAGADVLQVVSVLLNGGPEALNELREQTERWLDKHGFGSLAELRESRPDNLGAMATQRTEYIETLREWQR